MKFFTDRGDYLLVKIKDYLKMREVTKEKYKEILIDPGIFDLINYSKFSWEGKIDIDKFLITLPKNHFFSYDYPENMNLEFQDLFLSKSWENAKTYHYCSQFIVTVQFKFNHYWNFVEWFDKYNNLFITSGILGIGNCCLQKGLNPFLKHAFDYAFKHCKHPRIHIYGLNLKAIPYVYKLSKRYRIELSVDSVKWQYYKDSKLRDFHFNKYLEKIKSLGVKLT